MESISQEPQSYDLLILTDATVSMKNYLDALNLSLPKIISVSTLTGAFERIGVLAYRDYCGGQLTEWSGWYGRDGDISRDTLITFARRLQAGNGGDWPEATKTGFARAYSVMRPEAITLILLYTDAPPHMPWNTQPNRMKEKAMLSSGIFGPSSGLFVDWVLATRTLGGDGHERDGSAIRAQVFTIVQSHLVDTLTPYVYMCHETKGSCLQITDANSSLISSLTMSLLVAWMGVSKPGTSSGELAKLITYKDTSSIDQVQNEDDPKARVYFLQVDKPEMEKLVRDNLNSMPVDDEHLRVAITPRTPPLVDFAKRYTEDEGYRNLVFENLGNIIREDVSSIALNPVFGSLWRVVCNDRTNDARDSLIQSFGTSIEGIARPDEKMKMKAWLAESYNYAAEIAATIEEVSEQDQFPCVFLDPTQDWKIPSAELEDEESPTSILSFTRDELLEIGRSCDYRILRRLGRVLTRLTYVNSKDELPAHISNIKKEDVPQIPIALAQSRYKRSFWKILLHTVVPGTKLGARPAALLAALSIRMGIKPLQSAADSEMAGWKNNWNNLEIPETWNTNCLALILEADKNFEARRKTGEVVGTDADSISFLKNEDRKLFELLVDYSMLKANLNTTFSAKVGWRPEKSKIPVGHLVICNECQFPRSVTIMAPGGVCGLCVIPEKDFINGRIKSEVLVLNVSTDATERTEATWVECSIPTCRSQYIVYDAEGLRVRPKCHYCRQERSVPSSKRSNDRAPWVECTKCLNRVIWPEEYRPIDLNIACFQCTACCSGRATIIDVEITPKDLSEENGDSWLLRNSDKKIKKPFNDTLSLFKTITAAGTEDFVAKVEILPEQDATTLKVRGKLVRNADEIKSSLLGWIKSRRAEAGTCSLCFNDLKKQDLRSACGRSGCMQKICSNCRDQWYGINARGRLINVAALSCPFCRRLPAPNSVPRNGLAYLGDLRTAVEEAGEWIYAWCNDCGFARRFVERVCAQGAPAEVSRWDCDECKSKKGAGGRKIIRNCPRCDTATEKMGGCDHISCPCGTHWCFFCGEEPRDDIYQHMAEMHGGYFAGEEDEFGEEEYYVDMIYP